MDDGAKPLTACREVNPERLQRRNIADVGGDLPSNSDQRLRDDRSVNIDDGSAAGSNVSRRHRSILDTINLDCVGSSRAADNGAKLGDKAPMRLGCERSCSKDGRNNSVGNIAVKLLTL